MIIFLSDCIGFFSRKNNVFKTPSRSFSRREKRQGLFDTPLELQFNLSGFCCPWDPPLLDKHVSVCAGRTTRCEQRNSLVSTAMTSLEKEFLSPVVLSTHGHSLAFVKIEENDDRQISIGILNIVDRHVIGLRRFGKRIGHLK